MNRFFPTVTIVVLLAGTIAAFADELQTPITIDVTGKPIDVERYGHSAPFIGDFDGDGVRDLLVGQFHEGRLRIYRNEGSDISPKFESFTWFQAGGQLGRVPEG